ncbi:MAG TPA: hypothetical protein VEC14_00875 [Reyranellaceae bacterium]|nr:hypothetical protein [Reyranellaceae bacterium]
MKRTLVTVAVLVVPSIGSAQEFTPYPGLSPEQQRILEPIRTPPPAPTPSPPVPMIEPPARVQSTEPQITQFPGSSGTMGSPIDRRERPPPRGLKPSPVDRSKAPPDELTAPPSDLMQRAPPSGTTTTRTPPPVAAPSPVTPAPPVQAAPPPATDNVRRAPASTTSLPPPAPATTVTRTPQAAPPAYTQPVPPPPQVQTRAQPRPQPQVQPAPQPAPAPAQARPPAPHETPSHWQTVTLPPAPDFSRRDGPTQAPPAGAPLARPTDAAALGEGAARARIESDGYRQVSGLSRGADGVWRGRALRGGTEVGVRVDAQGRVSAE